MIGAQHVVATPWNSTLTGDDWRAPFRRAIQRRQRAEKVGRGAAFHFPLASDTLEAEDLVAAADTLLSGSLTMGQQVRRFESELATYLGVPCAVMVNSGSSANLIAVQGALELSGMGKLGRGLRRGDEVLVPALAWSTSLAPLVQLGLRPVLVDVMVTTLNIDVEACAERMTERTRAILLVHAMGNAPLMSSLMRLATAHDLVVIEDTCE